MDSLFRILARDAVDSLRVNVPLPKEEALRLANKVADRAVTIAKLPLEQWDDDLFKEKREPERTDLCVTLALGVEVWGHSLFCVEHEDWEEEDEGWWVDPEDWRGAEDAKGGRYSGVKVRSLWDAKNAAEAMEKSLEAFGLSAGARFGVEMVYSKEGV